MAAREKIIEDLIELIKSTPDDELAIVWQHVEPDPYISAFGNKFKAVIKVTTPDGKTE